MRVVDDERRVERVQLAGTVGVVRLGHVAGDALLRVPLERDELRDVLPSALLERPDGEVEDLDRVPASERDEIGGERLVVAAADPHVGAGAMRRLEMRAERMGMEARRAETRRHALREEPPVVRARHERPPGPTDGAEPLWDGSEQLLEAAAARMPELVGVRVEDPVGAEVGRREPCHPRDPLALAQVVARLADQVEHAVALVPLENLGRPVLRAVVRGDDEVDAGVEVVRDLRIDDVGLVADEECHDELHADVEG